MGYLKLNDLVIEVIRLTGEVFYEGVLGILLYSDFEGVVWLKPEEQLIEEIFYCGSIEIALALLYQLLHQIVILKKLHIIGQFLVHVIALPYVELVDSTDCIETATDGAGIFKDEPIHVDTGFLVLSVLLL